jgi:hypothetical protein
MDRKLVFDLVIVGFLPLDKQTPPAKGMMAGGEMV